MTQTLYVLEYRYPDRESWQCVHSQPVTKIGNEYVRGVGNIEDAKNLKGMYQSDDTTCQFRIVPVTYTMGTGEPVEDDTNDAEERDMTLTEQIEALQGQVAAMRKALEEISIHYGKVCDNFELCDHPACASSYGAWEIADAILRDTDAGKREAAVMAQNGVAPDEVIEVLKQASEALSHASYCARTGTCPNHVAIEQPWQKLREVIECLAPRFRFHPEPNSPTLKIIAIKETGKREAAVIAAAKALYESMRPIRTAEEGSEYHIPVLIGEDFFDAVDALYEWPTD